MQHCRSENEASGKPEIVNYYNETKSGIDILDMKCAIYASKEEPGDG